MFAIVLILIVTCLIIKWKYNRNQVYKGIQQLPGPKGVPLLGNILDVGFDYNKLLSNLFTLQKRHGPVYKLWIGPMLKVVIADPDTAQQVLASTKNINKSNSYDVLKPWLGNSIVMEVGSKWKTIRKRVMPAFNLNILKGYMKVNNHHSEILIEQLSKQLDKKVDMLPFMYAVTVDIISETVLGESFEMQYKPDNQFVKHTDQVLTLSMKRIYSIFEKIDCIYKLLPNYRKLKKLLLYIDNFVDNVIRKRQDELKQKTIQCKTKSILDILLESANDSADLTTVRYNLHAFLFAGFDTTTITLCFALYELAKRPDIQDKLYKESVEVLGNQKETLITYDSITKMKYLDCVMKETLRLYSTLSYIERKLSEDIYYDGVKIPSGTDVSVFIYGIHLSEKLYENANTFDPNRFSSENSINRHPFAYIPFSAGPRNCIGFVYADFQFKTVLSKIIRNFKVEAVDGYKPDYMGIGVIRIVNGLQVLLKER